MKSMGAYEAKTHWSQLLEEVEQGERITITRHGKPVALLSPANEGDRSDVRKAIQEIHAFRSTHRLSGLNNRELIDEGRR